MPSRFSSLLEEARLAARAIQDFGSHLVHPTVRLGVTGLSRAGKTVFITAVVHGLTRGGRFPVFESLATGRIEGARLAPQPDDAVPRFAYEKHLRALVDERRWPSSTTDISELRLVIDYQSANRAQRSLTLDIVDYPGEWLLDLPLLEKTFEQWARREPCIVARRDRGRRSGQRLARAPCDAGAEGARQRAGRAERGTAVHGLPEGVSRRALRHEPLATRALPVARRDGRHAGADLCAARRARRRRARRRIRSGR